MLRGIGGEIRSLNVWRASGMMASMIGALMWGTCVAHAALPDGRAWEMISPPGKNGGDIQGIDGVSSGGVVQASRDGEAITYVSLASFGQSRGAALGSQYVAGRHAEAGWATQNISLPMSAQTYGLGGQGTPYDAFSEDLSDGLVYGGAGGPAASPPLGGAPAGYENYYLHSIGDGVLRPLLSEPPSMSAEMFRMALLGATPDLTQVVVESPAVLGSGAIEEEEESNLYEWERATGLFQTVNILPDGSPDPEGTLTLGGRTGAVDHAISDDGSRVIWTGAPPPPLGGTGLYVRDGIGTAQPHTVQIDAASQGGDPESSHGGIFLMANSDDSKIFFTDHTKLTAETTAKGGAEDLYEFDLNAPEGQRLKDLTVDPTPADPQGADVQGVVAASEDGSYIYFVANGVLASGASLGNCRSPASPAGATCNLYLSHEGETKFITTLAGNDENEQELVAPGVAYDWNSRMVLRTTRASSDGTRLLFMSERSLTSYDNTVSGGGSCGVDASGGPLPTRCQEVFFYDANTDSLSCVSCNPSGAHPIGASSIPGGTGFYNNRAMRQSRVLSEGEDGVRIFFDSFDALVPQDTNGRRDVYGYEDGHVHLLSGGRDAGGAAFVDASADGDDVFFITREQLVGQDNDQLVDLYDARLPHVAGERVGFPLPTPPFSCQGEDCRTSASVPPPFASFSSTTLSAVGNIVPAAPKPVVKPKAKRIKKKPKKGRKRSGKGRATGIRGTVKGVRAK